MTNADRETFQQTGRVPARALATYRQRLAIAGGPNWPYHELAKAYAKRGIISAAPAGAHFAHGLRVES
jgi:hypothetical protein